ncbi:MAG: HAD family phosphatase [Actinobacteria bacterium]|nr:MAG: HAD family phosphatase [Actinomycetota bacterium]
MTAPAAVIFDLDGVLIDSETVWNEARRELVERSGGTWREDAQRAMMGMSSIEWSRYMSDELGVPMSRQAISEAVVESLESRYRAELPLIAGAREAVLRLAGRWPLGLASSANGSIIELVLRESGLADRFDATVSSEEVSRGKPAPDVYLEAARRLDRDPALCVAVEDSSNGLRAAAEAGMGVIAIPNRAFPPDPDALGSADVVLESIDGLDAAVVARLE